LHMLPVPLHDALPIFERLDPCGPRCPGRQPIAPNPSAVYDWGHFMRAVHTGLYVMMGVCGSGKSLIGAELARALDIEFVEGDDLHPPDNVQRMAAGIPLSDADRHGWLLEIATRL